ncbi:MAG: putative rane protein, partial [Ramlibacter sp.]|nr:putative rane protein [Ramlibacter sp.]
MATHKTSAWPLAQAYAALIVYASLYPFSGWRDQGIAPWAFLASPWPKYWTGFDIAANLVGYAPFGFLLALSFLRRGGKPVMPSNSSAIVVATLVASLLSLCMEALQSYLPFRVPSNLDFALNALGALIGAAVAGGLELAGAIDRWSRFRLRWFVEDARGALVLLALWPFALLFPASVPLGLGQVFERLENGLAEWLLDTPF